ncbi:MAG: AI-2E family transporter [Candidatus Marinimicrobia bacterium]|jgi:predicted PurR-regulated permease PerM|nr:AI-2E family transporter [Candidatus Neomarinimicrobiota bacterium]|tara:strand:+ start:3279 stop:4385 length:1107 start_codon:yes stop_codon:yes gene_type:complete
MDPLQKIYRLLLFIIIGLLSMEILPFLSSIIGMLVFSFLFTTIFLQAVDSIERYTRSRALGVFLILSTTIMIGVLFIGSFISNLGSQIKLFTQKIQREDFTTSIENLSISIRDSLPDMIANLIPESEKIILIAKNVMVGIFQSVLSLLGSAGSLFFIAFMVLIFTIILLIEYHDFKRSLVRFMPNKYLEVGLRMIYNIELQISKYLRGQILAASSVAILSIMGLFLLNQLGANITLIVFIGIIAGLANLIPMVGPFIGMIPAILIALMNNIGSDIALNHQIFGSIPSPFFVLDIIIMFIIVQQIDNNFITPLVVGESVGLHPMAVMLVLLIGGTLIGPLGMLFAIPVAGVLKVVMTEIIFITKNSHLL